MLIALMAFSSCSAKESETQTATPSATPSSTPSVTPSASATAPEAQGLSFSNLANPDFPYDPREIKAGVRDYTVNADLSNITNMDMFGFLTENQKKMIAENGFVVTPTNKYQFAFLYDENMYKGLPSFVTTDSMLQIYHLFFDFALRNAEASGFLPLMEKLTKDMYDELLSGYKTVSDEKVKTNMEYAIAYFAVANALLFGDLPPGMPEQSKALAESELDLVKNVQEFKKSPIAGTGVFYENFVIRGHYTNSEDLGRYFLAMMWYGTIPFTADDEDGLIRAFLITKTLISLGQEGVDNWRNVYAPTAFFVGDSDDFTPFEYYEILTDVFGELTDLNALNNSALLEQAAKIIYEKDKARIVNNVIGVDQEVTMNPAPQFRFMGQRYIPDSEIMQNLIYPIERPFPKGLDVFAVLGFENAEKHLKTYDPKVTTWKDYPKKFKEMTDKFDVLPEETWRSNAYYGWMWTLKSLIPENLSGSPAFMKSEAWRDKSLATALGSWTELRHDTILYGKQSGAEMGGGWDPHLTGYVEPNIELYERLKWLVGYTAKNLKARGILSEFLEEKSRQFSELLEKLIVISEKELNNEEITEDELYYIMGIGGRIESLSVSIASDGKVFRFGELAKLDDNWEIITDGDSNIALIADISKIPGASLFNAVGYAAQIFAVVPSPDGTLYLTRGGVFDYFEFISEDMWTDDMWQKTLKEGNIPQRPEWVESFLETTGYGIEIPYWEGPDR